MPVFPYGLIEFGLVFSDRQKVLRHHPDKRKAAGEEIRNDDDYFTCITRAYETLSVASRRRAYDSVDPDFDDQVPPINATNKARFFEVLLFFYSYLFFSRRSKEVSGAGGEKKNGLMLLVRRRIKSKVRKERWMDG